MRLRRSLNLAELPHRLHQQYLELVAGAKVFWSQVRDDPAALWHNPLLQFGFWILLLIVGLTAGGLTIRNLAFPADDRFKVEAPVAIIHVACTDPACAAEKTVEVDLDFDDWPMKCESCGRESVYRAKQCHVCKGWYAVRPDQPDECPHCAKAAAEAPPDPTKPPPPTGDDAEDGW